MKGEIQKVPEYRAKGRWQLGGFRKGLPEEGRYVGTCGGWWG